MYSNKSGRTRNLSALSPVIAGLGTLKEACVEEGGLDTSSVNLKSGQVFGAHFLGQPTVNPLHCSCSGFQTAKAKPLIVQSSLKLAPAFTLSTAIIAVFSQCPGSRCCPALKGSVSGRTDISRLLDHSECCWIFLNFSVVGFNCNPLSEVLSIWVRTLCCRTKAYLCMSLSAPLLLSASSLSSPAARSFHFHVLILLLALLP